jgi:fructokinase
VQAVAALVRELEQGQGRLPVGICTPGAIDPESGRIKNANSTCLNGQRLQEDLQVLLARPVRLANDADCLAVSEAADGAAAGAPVVFAVILGTGVGGGIVIDGRLLQGPNAIAGEWGHNPLPWPQPAMELPGPACWCGQHGCIETWLSGPGLAEDHRRHTRRLIEPPALVRLAESGDAAARVTLDCYADRLARALASVINILDPTVIVLGGGISRLGLLYDEVPRRWGRYVFSAQVRTALRAARHGDSSGVRGAAWLWPAPGTPRP